jgi:L-fuconate dehydratase
VMNNGKYMPPTAPGYSITMLPESIATYEFPGGAAWA